MPKMIILNEQEIKEYDYPPHFQSADRKQFLTLPVALQKELSSFRTLSNRVLFHLTFAHFKACGRFFSPARTNENGNCEIFTRAIDTAKPLAIVNAIGELPPFAECDDLDYFDIADRTWSNLQSEIAQFLTTNGGAGTIKDPSVVHLDFKQVYEKLKSDTPVNFISC